MKIRLSLTVATAALAAGAWGCGPPQLAPVTPPGLDVSRITPTADEAPAEAVGESRNFGGVGSPSAPTGATQADSPPTEAGQPRTTKSGLTYVTLKPGTGSPAKSGQTVTVHYTGTLAKDGTQFDSSRGKGTGFTFVLGTGAVIPGWDEGVAGMKVGERRKLTVPPKLGYGDIGKGPIPGAATLNFDVELLKIQ